MKAETSESESISAVGSTDLLGITNHEKRTPMDILNYWRAKLAEERLTQASCLRHGMPDQSKWHEGKADAIDQFADELEFLILPQCK